MGKAGKNWPPVLTGMNSIISEVTLLNSALCGEIEHTRWTAGEERIAMKP